MLPGGLKGAECFRDSPLLVEKVRQMHLQGNIVAAICAAPALVLQHHDLFPVGNMTGFHWPESQIRRINGWSAAWWYDARVNLLTSPGPGTAMSSR